ncbi:hypothetical protein AU467_06080 [Mesorhizobium loti]|uniref:Uncharacterized protein n=1 Tax=Rhizobium loti TaxID=381 RepID=A0A101KPN5_RHILI|nr:hypothetical protein AU467_06080 [Mesorhizobium loti]
MLIGFRSGLGFESMKNQSWKTSVELDQVEGAAFVRVIEDGVVRIKTFKSEAEAKAFANSEKVRLGLNSDRR